jgi:pimeloyl-ACP methyl ester carboxylesterase
MLAGKDWKDFQSCLTWLSKWRLIQFIVKFLILGKRWGNPDGIPVLCLHGWLDNACSFDGLAPLMPNETHNFVAIDLPGHGFSTHYPAGMTYRFSDGFTVIRYVQDYMKWDKSAIVAHSLGAGIGIWYTSIFPESVERLICIDLINVGPLTLEKHVKHTKKSILSGVDTFRKLTPVTGQDKPHKVPTYSYEDAVARAFMANQLAHGSEAITQASVETLMKRSLKKVSDGDEYTWTADLRLRIPSAFHVLIEQVEHYAAAIKCPMMLIKASNSPYYMSDEMAKRILKVYMNHNPNFEFHKVQGGHSVHLNTPNVVGDLIRPFLTKTAFKEEDDEALDKQENFPLDLF